MKHMFKTVTVIIVGIMSSGDLWALPVLNKNVCTNEKVLCTIFPDHKDPNLFYMLPTMMKVAENEKGRKMFTFVEYLDPQNIFAIRALVQFVMGADTDSQVSKEARASVAAKVPTAQFSMIPYLESNIEFNTVWNGRIKTQDCHSRGGVVGTLQGCSLDLDDLGRRLFKKSIEQQIAIPFALNFTISGVAEMANGEFKDTQAVQSVTGVIQDIDFHSL